MNNPIVAIIGRTNVGKSTIFNRILGRKLAIVDEESGVTRDIKFHEAEWNGKHFTVVDTGGLVPNSDDKMEQSILSQAAIAIEKADLIVFAVDSKIGVSPLDKHITELLRPVSDRIITVANKVDNEKAEMDVYEFMELGLGEVMGISALNGHNFADFLDELTENLPEIEAVDEEETDYTSIAIVGKPNVGKSSLVNQITGQQAVIVREEPGTTRDSIHLNFYYEEEKLRLIDTAGLRRKSNVDFGIEYFSNLRSIRSIDNSDIVVVMIDAPQKVSAQDKRIIRYARSRYKNIILAINKWDLIEKDGKTFNKFIDYYDYVLDFVSYAPYVFISAKFGTKIAKLLDKILEVRKQNFTRIKTAELNKFIEKTVAKVPPHHPSRKRVKVYYCTEAQVDPPTFIFSVNNPSLITKNYKKYLINEIRREYGFEGVTLKLKFKER